MSKRRVVITGMGIVSPVGLNLTENWANITAGVSGIGAITRFDASGITAQIAGEVKGFDITQYIPAKDARRMDTFIHYGLAAGMQAFKDAGLVIDEHNAHRVGVNIGSGIGGLPLIEETGEVVRKSGARKISPFFIPGSIINMAAGNLSILLGLKGPNVATVSACSTGTHAIGQAMRMIQYNEVDAMLAGGTEATVTPLAVGGFASARALSTRNDDPSTASRPWDMGRDGFVLGEGAGVVMLEEYEHAKARGARIYAEVIGFGMNSDAFHITQPVEDGSGACACMELALRDAGLNRDAVDYVNAHGTSTPLGDIAETVAIKRCFGEQAARLMVSSTKSMTGHLLGAAGGVEAIYSALALYHGVVPPTANLHEQDPACDLDYVPLTARQADLQVALSNSFGFGGTNGTLVFRKV